MNKINPDSVVLGQLDGQWQKIALFLLWKMAGRNKVVKITHEEMAACIKEFAPGAPVIFTHGKSDSLEFSLVMEEAAHRLAEHDKTMRGRA